MLKSEGSGYLKWPVSFILVSLALNLSMHAYYCPLLLANENVEKECQMDILFKIYIQSYTRMGPYFFGMISAYWVLRPD